MSVNPIDDTLVEGDETVVLTPSGGGGTGYTVSGGAATVIIHDNDAKITVTAPDPSASEAGPDTGKFTFHRQSGGDGGAVTVAYTLSGTASSGDYSISGTATIPSGGDSADLIVTPVNDTLVEDDETVVLTINSVSNPSYAAASGGDGTATVTIRDNDSWVSVGDDGDGAETLAGETPMPGHFVFNRSNTNGALTVYYTLSGVALPGTDYDTPSGSVTFADGEDSVVLDINPIDDVLIEPAESVVLTVSSDPGTSSGGSYQISSGGGEATIHIDDNEAIVSISPTVQNALEKTDNYPGQKGYFTVIRTGYLDRALTVNLTSDGTATYGGDYLLSGGYPVHFDKMQSSVTVLVDPLHDTLTEGDEYADFTIMAATDKSYVKQSPDTARVVIEDMPVPTIDTVTPDTGALNDDKLTKVSAQVFTGTARPGSAVTLTANIVPRDTNHDGVIDENDDNRHEPKEAGPVTADSSGHWALTLAPDMLTQEHWEFQATYKYGSAKSDESNKEDRWIDLTTPTVSINGISPEPPYRNGHITVQITAEDLPAYYTPPDLYYGLYWEDPEHPHPPGTSHNVAAKVDIDINGDGVFEESEKGLRGASLTLDSAGIRGTATLDLDLPFDEGTHKVRVRVPDWAGNEGSASASFTITPRKFLAGGEGYQVSTSDLKLSEKLDLDVSPASCGCQLPSLNYDSGEVNTAPIVQVVVATNPSEGIPTGITAKLWWDGLRITRTGDLAGVDADGFGVPLPDGYESGPFTIAFRAPPDQKTGQHRFKVEFTATYSDCKAQKKNVTGFVYAVNRNDSEFGQGWNLSNVDLLINVPATPRGDDPSPEAYASPRPDSLAIVPVSLTQNADYPAMPGGELRVYGRHYVGQGTGWDFYAVSSSGGGYTSPAGDYGTLSSFGDGYQYVSVEGKKLTFDSLGDMTRWETPSGEVFQYSYEDKDGDSKADELTQMIAADHSVTDFNYVGYHVQSITTHKAGGAGGSRSVQLEYSGNFLSRITKAAGTLLTYTQGEDGRISDRRLGGAAGGGGAGAEASPETAHYDYEDGALTADQEGGQPPTDVKPMERQALDDTIPNDPSGESTDPLGKKTKTQYDRQGRPTRVTAPDGGVTTYTWWAGNNLSSMTDPLGRVSTWTRDSAGYVLTETLPGRGTTQYSYGGPYHSLLTVTDALGRITTFTYNSAGQLLTTTDPLGRVSANTYDSDGLLKTVTDAMGHVTTSVYDSYRRLVNTLRPGGRMTTTSYDPLTGETAGTTDITGFANSTTTYDAESRAVGRLGADGLRTTTIYDTAGRVWKTIGQDGVTTEYGYDSNGQTTLVTETAGGLTRTTVSAYDAAGRLVNSTDALGRVTTYEYDVMGRQKAVVTPELARTETTYDLIGRPVTMTDPLNHVTTMVYDPAGLWTETIDPLGHMTTVVNDLMGNTVATIDANGNSTLTGYDADNEPVTSTDALNHVTTTTYDSLGRVIAVESPPAGTAEEPLRVITTTVYDEYDRVAATIDPLGRRTTTVYDSADYPVATIDPRGHRTTTLYDSAHRVIGSVDALGHETDTIYDALGRIQATRDALGRLTTTVYDGFGREVGMIRPDRPGVTVITTAYDNDDRVMSSADPAGNATTTEYDDATHSVTVTDPMGYKTVNIHDLAGQETVMIDPLLRRTTTVYDDAGRVTVTYDAMNRPTTYHVDPAGNVLTVTAPGGKVTTTTYDALNRPLTVTDPLGYVTATAYDASGNVSSQTDARSHETRTEYDQLGRPVKIIDARGKETVYAYAGDDAWATVTDPLGHTTTTTYDALGREDSTTDPLGHTTTTVYDRTGNVEATVDALGHATTTVYDALGRPVATIDALNHRTTTVYDLADRVTDEIDANNHAAHTDYDADGRVILTTDAAGRTTAAAYDHAGQVTAVTDPRGGVTQYEYDALGRVVTVTDALENVTSTTYATDDSSATVTDAKENQTTTLYDLDGRPVVTIDAHEKRTTVAYDQNGHVISRTDANLHTVSTAYDELDRVVLQTDAMGKVTTYSYDDASRLVAVTNPLRDTTTTVYDDAGRPYKTIDGEGNVTTTVYDAAGRVTQQTDANRHTTGYEYDDAGRLHVTVNALGQRTTSTLDAVGNVTGTLDWAGRRTTATFDAINRPLVETDALGHSSSTSYAGDDSSVTATDKRGHATTVEYDLLGRQSVVIDALGGRTTTLYDPNGNAISRTDANHHLTTMAYDELNRLIAQTDPEGGVTQAGYDYVGNRTVVVDADNNVTTTVYDEADRPTAVIDASGGSYVTAYDDAGHVKTQTDANGHSTGFAYDHAGRRVAVVNALGQRTTATLDGVGNTTGTLDWVGRTTATEYDGLNRPTVETDALGHSSLTSYALDESSITLTDKRGNTTTVYYDALGRAVATLDALGGRATTVYDNNGNITGRQDPLGRTTATTYDNLDRPETMTDPAGDTTTDAYDAVGNLLSQTDPLGHMVTFSYDRADRRTGQTDALGNSTVIVYDQAGNVIRTIDAATKVTTYAYDSLNRQTSVTTPGTTPATSHTEYDHVGNITARVDALGNRTATVYDELDRPETVTDPLGGVTSYGYDTAGNLSSLTDPGGSETVFTYDALGQKLTETAPPRWEGDDSTTTYAYDEAGNLSHSIDATSREKTFTHDALNRLTAEVWSKDVTTVETKNYVYDAASQLLEAGETSTGTYVFDYDAAGRVDGVTDPTGTVMTFDYDAAGNRTGVADSLGGLQTSVYDAANQLLSRVQTGEGGTVRVDYGHTARGQVSGLTRYADAAGTVLAGSTAQTYDDAGRLATQTHSAATTTLQTVTYAYDQAGRVTSQTVNGATTAYSYDANDELTGDGTTVHSYDAAGNRTDADADINVHPGNQAWTFDGWEAGFDANGNRTDKVDVNGDGGRWAYQYDFDNHLTYAEHRNPDGDLIQAVTFDYDVFGNRIRRVELNAASEVVSENRYLYDGWKVTQDALGNRPSFVGQENWDVWADLNGDNELEMRRVYGDGVDEPLARISAAGETAFYVTDRQGSVTGLLDSSGTVIDQISYDGFGKVTAETTPAVGDRYGYTGREEDIGGLVFLRDRVLTHDTGTFLSRDRMGFAAGDYNLSRYVGNGFTNGNDPSGRGMYDLVKRGAMGEEKTYSPPIPGIPGSGFGTPPPSTPLPGLQKATNGFPGGIKSPPSGDGGGGMGTIPGGQGGLGSGGGFGGMTVTPPPPPPPPSSYRGQRVGADISKLSQMRIDELVNKYNAIRGQDGLVGFSDVGPDGDVYQFVYRPNYEPCGHTKHDTMDGREPFRNILVTSIQDYELIHVQRFPVLSDGAREATKVRLRGAHLIETVRRVADLQKGREAESQFRNIFLAVDMVPIAGTINKILDGHYGEAGISALDDVAFFATLGSSKIGTSLFKVECSGLRKLRGITALSLGATGIARGFQAADDLARDDYQAGILHIGEGFLRLLGATDSFIKYLKTACFVRGTPVSTENGFRPIEEIQVGDRVWACDLSNGQWQLRSVTKTFQNYHSGDFVRVTVDGETLESTPGHPYWIVEGANLVGRPSTRYDGEHEKAQGLHGRWVQACYIQAGDIVQLTASRKKPVSVIEKVKNSCPVYNFEVEGLGNYVVGYSEILVHNGGPDVEICNRLAHNGKISIPFSRPPAIGKIDYGSTYLSRLAQYHRTAEGLTESGKNIAVFEYKATDGTLKTIVKSSEFTAGHAERLIATELGEKGINADQVTRIYSELQPCVIPTEAAGCSRFLQKTFPQAEVSWSFDYGATRLSRQSGVEALKNAASSLDR
ncbi:nucleic acid/nucleotide deaminase domain-containing protein [Zavarzinella formosa]|uniref:nucleic acid/nucleotide deaminase domain-containing protein n=1 Tax=Zavarzinella formosa TaxID=360055 RepID=UPI0002EE877E